MGIFISEIIKLGKIPRQDNLYQSKRRIEFQNRNYLNTFLYNNFGVQHIQKESSFFFPQDLVSE